jgi:hypothetical protein
VDLEIQGSGPKIFPDKNWSEKPNQNFFRKKTGSKNRTKIIPGIKLVRFTEQEIFQEKKLIGKSIKENSEKKS